VPDETMQVLQRIDAKLGAILSLLADQLSREAAGNRHRPRTMDRMLTDAGLNPTEVGRVLGKSRQAVSQVLARDGKPSKKTTESSSNGA